MLIEQLVGCCACGILFDFPDNYLLKQQTKKQAINSVKTNILDEVVEDAIEHGNPIGPKGFSLYIAITNTKQQSLAEQALIELGFKSFTFDSIMGNTKSHNNALKFWKRHGMPREAYDRVRAFLKNNKDNEE